MSYKMVVVVSTLAFLLFLATIVLVFGYVTINQSAGQSPSVSPLAESKPTSSASALTDEQQRSQLCPGITDPKLKVRYSKTSGKCHTIGTKGPCKNNLIFLAESNSSTVYGQCDCPVNSRTLIYHPNTNMCYIIFQKAYCPNNKWLTLNRTNGMPICETNPCYSLTQSSNNTDEYVLINNSCVKLYSICESGSGSGKIMFTKGRILPYCATPKDVQTSAFAIGAPVVSCGPGSYLSLSGNCQSSWEW